MLSVCGGRLGSGRTYAQYRTGLPGNPAVVHPARIDGEKPGLTWARTGYSGGGELQYRFVREGLEHVVYSRVVRTGFGPDGHFNPDFQAGIFVRSGGRLVSDRRCSDSLDAVEGPPEEFMPEGEFVFPE